MATNDNHPLNEEKFSDYQGVEGNMNCAARHFEAHLLDSMRHIPRQGDCTALFSTFLTAPVNILVNTIACLSATMYRERMVPGMAMGQIQEEMVRLTLEFLQSDLASNVEWRSHQYLRDMGGK